MYIITHKEGNEIAMIGERYTEAERVHYIDDVYGFDKACFIVAEVEDVEKGIGAYRHCYTPQDGFYPNPNWHEPSAYDLAPSEVVDAIIDEYTNELIEMGVL